MNQKSKKLLGPKSLWLNRKLLHLLFSGLIGFAFTTLANAQNQFAPATNFQQPEFGNWTPPNSAGSDYQNNVASSRGFNVPGTNRPSSVSFPESIAPFETGIRTANFEAPVPDLAAQPSSITDKLDGATAVFSKWKDIAGDKASTLLGSANREGGWLEKIKSFIGTSDIKKMVGSLAVVLGLYFAFVWLMRKLNIGGNASLPRDVVDVLGQAPFGARRNLQLIRLGSKVLLLLNSPEGTQPLGEITDPGEVEHLVSLCQGKRRSPTRRSSAAVEQAATQIAGGNATQPKLGNIGSSNLNDVIRILQQAANPGRAVFEA